MSHSVFSAHRIVFGGIKHGFQNTGTALRLAILPLVLIALIYGVALTLMDLKIKILAIIALSLPLLFMIICTLPITFIHFANSGEIGHNITGHTTKGLGKWLIAYLKFGLIMLALGFLSGMYQAVISKISPPSFVASSFAVIIQIIGFYVGLRLTPFLIYPITEGISSVRHTLRLTRHRVWFLLRCLILLALLSIIFYSLILSVPMATIWPTLSDLGQGANLSVLKHELLTNRTRGLLLLNALWIISLVIFHYFIHTMVAVRIANVLKNNPPQS